MYLTQAAPGAVALATADAKTHMRISGSGDDTYIAALIEVATKSLESSLAGALINRTVTYKLDRFPSAPYALTYVPDCGAIDLPLAPVQSVTSVQYVDDAGATQTFSAGSYSLDAGSRPARILLNTDAAWPSTRVQPLAVTLTYVAGYGAAQSALPAPLVHALKLLVAHYYEHREEGTPLTIAQIPLGIQWLLAPYRCWTQYT